MKHPSQVICLNRYSAVMRNSKDKKLYRMQMVHYAKKHGFKPTARMFKTTVKTVKKWFRRFESEKYVGLEDKSHAPHYSPHAITDFEKAYVCFLKKKRRGFGAQELKNVYQLDLSVKAIRRAWREQALLKKKRRKHKTKQNLREIKKLWGLFKQFDVDTKHLYDIPELWPYIQENIVPKYQYTFREVFSGLQFLAFADEYNMAYSCLFMEVILDHLVKSGVDLKKNNTRGQTDNGSEFIGAWNKKGDSEFTKVLASYGVPHQTIPAGAHTWQSDVETTHRLIEDHLYLNETYNSREDFLNKAGSYLLMFNSIRKNSYKENKSPWQLIREESTTIDKQILNLPPFRLDYLFQKMPMVVGGYNPILHPYYAKTLGRVIFNQSFYLR